jgi:hypothetical protein
MAPSVGLEEALHLTQMLGFRGDDRYLKFQVSTPTGIRIWKYFNVH